MATPLALPTYLVEVAFTTNPGDPAPSWTDITAYVHGMTIKSASRQRELDRFEAGTLDALLDNSDGRFSPNNTGSPYAPNVVPLRRIRVRATWNAVTYTLFDGYVEDWPMTTDYPFVGAVKLKAADAFTILAATPLLESAFANQVTLNSPAVWWRLAEPSGRGPMVDAWTGGYDGAYEDAPPLAGDALAQHGLSSGVFEVGSQQRGHFVATSGGPITAYPYTIEALIKVPSDETSVERMVFNLRSGDGYGLQLSVIGTWSYWDGAVGADNSLRGHVGVYVTSAGQTRSVYSSVPVDDGFEHHVMVVATSATDIKLYVDGADDVDAVFGTGSPVFPTAPLHYVIGNGIFSGGSEALNGNASDIVGYTSALGSGVALLHAQAALTGFAGDSATIRFLRILLWAGWSPSGLVAYGDPQSTVQAQAYSNALSDLQTLADSEFGAVFCRADGYVYLRGRHDLLKSPYLTSLATFSDQAAGINYDDVEPDFAVDMIRNIGVVGRAGGPPQRVQNAASILKYRHRKYEKTSLLMERDSEARDQAQFVVNRFPEPPFRYGKLTLTPYGAETTLMPLVLGLGVSDRVTAQQKAPGDASVRSQDAHVDGKTLRIGDTFIECDLQLSPADTTSYFVLGTSTLGGAHVLGY